MPCSPCFCAGDPSEQMASKRAPVRACFEREVVFQWYAVMTESESIRGYSQGVQHINAQACSDGAWAACNAVLRCLCQKRKTARRAERPHGRMWCLEMCNTSEEEGGEKASATPLQSIAPHWVHCVQAGFSEGESQSMGNIRPEYIQKSAMALSDAMRKKGIGLSPEARTGSRRSFCCPAVILLRKPG